MKRPARSRKVVLLAREDDGGGRTATLDRGLAPAAPEPHTKGASRQLERYHLSGLDAHKISIHFTMLAPGRAEPLCWQEADEETAVRRLARRLIHEVPGEVRGCYEAGPLGYALQRELAAQGVIREVWPRR